MTSRRGFVCNTCISAQAGRLRYGNRSRPHRRVTAPSRSPRGARRGFTMTDLVGVLCIILMLFLLLYLVLPRPREGDWRVKCGSNLRQIGQAMRQYAIDHNGAYPRAFHDPDDPTPRFFTGADAPNPFGPGGPAANDVTAVGWLLLREYVELPVEVFTCPSTDYTPFDVTAFGKRVREDLSNFPDRRFLSYSFANPYPSRALQDAGWKWSDDRPSTFVLAGDLNPGTPQLLALSTRSSNSQLSAGNSRNHGRRGQSVLFGDGSVRFATTPLEGPRRDNIYTAGGYETLDADPPVGGEVIVSPPLTPLDSVLLPTADAPLGPEPPSRSDRNFWLYIGLPGLLLGGALITSIIVLATRARRRKLERGELPELPPV